MADSIWFYVGRRGGQRVLRLFCRLSLARNSCVGRTKGLFARHGSQALVAAKFLPGLGSVMPPLAGALGMSSSRFLIFDVLGSLVYGAFYVTAGFLFHNQLGQALAFLNRLGLSVLLLALVLVAAYVAFKYVRQRHTLSKALKEPANDNIEIAGTVPVAVTGRDDLEPEVFPQEGLTDLQLPGVVLAVAGSPTRGDGVQAVAPPVPARV